AERDVLGEELLGQRLADRLRLVLLLAGERGPVLDVRGGRQDGVRRIVDRLDVDVLRRPEDRQPRSIRGAGELLPDRALATLTRRNLFALDLLHAGHLRYSALRSAGLADLALDGLFQVLHALALVRLGRPERADLRRRLAEELAVDPEEREEVLLDLRRD